MSEAPEIIVCPYCEQEHPAEHLDMICEGCGFVLVNDEDDEDGETRP